MLEGVFNVSKIRFAISSLILLSLAVGLAWGQGIVTGSMSGTMQDAQQAVIAGASITASNVATNTEFKTQTDSQGFFQLKNLPIGMYNVTVEARSFAKLVLRNVSVETGRHTATGVQVMKVGSTSETVTVESAAPRARLAARVADSGAASPGGVSDQNSRG
ncbi:MAG TPA: carboxypeptidase-like regulatory domain-containing protein [Terriglobales bacterium]